MPESTDLLLMLAHLAQLLLLARKSIHHELLYLVDVELIIKDGLNHH